MRDINIITQRRSRLSPEQVKRRTEAQNAARERKRLAESKGLADSRYTNSDQPELPLQIIIQDHRFGDEYIIDGFRSNRINSYNFYRGDKFIGKFGIARFLRELSKMIPNLTNIE